MTEQELQNASDLFFAHRKAHPDISARESLHAIARSIDATDETERELARKLGIRHRRSARERIAELCDKRCAIEQQLREQCLALVSDQLENEGDDPSARLIRAALAAKRIDIAMRHAEEMAPEQLVSAWELAGLPVTEDPDA